ncbi:helix-turn-helix domain-containing protein [Microbacterium sp. SLBN-111]|uniref:helix-turn-helix domain-containing protein n=1 Tax=Microbacterium sp. SLBN-111 TaxID=3377733 RepID=UPI003C71171A
MSEAHLSAGDLPRQHIHTHPVDAVELATDSPVIGGHVESVDVSSGADLFSESQAVIEEHFHDPDFDVSELARRLNVSVSHLHRVFSANGTTPRREIERYRLEVVERRLAEIRTFEKIVDEAGFTSVRHYNAAAARFLARRSARMG